VKLHVEGAGVGSRITAYGDDWIEVDRVRHQGALALMPERGVMPWPEAQFEALTAAHFDGLIEWQPDVVLLGTGARLKFPHPRLVAGLAATRVGVEAMDTAAACRTYNVLAGEGRRVIAVFLPTVLIP
jgi:uncharacterized protein